jgi:glucose-6-phosphate dehydrogenase assembly protein OpcA
MENAMTTDIIPPSEIQSELTRIWEGLEGTNKMRASLFNLIFFTKKKERAGYIRDISHKVIEKFPSRIIFITADTETDQDYLNTRVSVVPSSKGEVDIACDFIQIDVAGKHRERIPFLILPHLLPDLPIYAIWAEDPSEETPLFTLLQKISNRLIFDSEAITDLSQFSNTLLQFKEQKNCDIADLNWGRMESWRELLASTFYTMPRLNQLRNATKIQILYNATTSEVYCYPQIQSIYLQGWLASQLGWELEKMESEKGTISYLYRRERGKVEVTLYPEMQKNIKSGNILSVDIETGGQEHFSFGRNLEMPHHVSMRFSTLEKCRIPLKYILAKDESGHSLVKEITHNGTSTHFTNLLHKIQGRKEYSSCEY